VLLEVGLGTLTARTDRDSKVFERGAARRELVQVWSCVVQPDDKETDAVWTPAVLTWASGYGASASPQEWRSGTRRTVGDGGYESVDGNGSVEHHLGAHGLLAHEIATRECEKKGASDIVREVGSAYLRTHASDVRPAIAIPIWSSIRNIFC
jgi:hypothetical protein